MIDLAVATARPEQVCGIHFFNPAPVMKLVEVVRPLTACAETIDTAMAFVTSCGKDAVEVQDHAGFIVNALLFPYLNNAVRMLERGTASIESIDTAMKGGCNFPMGPFALLDLVGLDTSVAILETIHDVVRQSGRRAGADAARHGCRRPSRSQDEAGFLHVLNRPDACSNACRDAQLSTWSRRPPIEPPANRWRLPAPEFADESGLCGIGADLEPGTLLAAYRSGIFPMPVRKKTLGLVVARPARRDPARRADRVAFIAAKLPAIRGAFRTPRFREVMERCGDPSRPHGWITPAVRRCVRGAPPSRAGFTASRRTSTAGWSAVCTASGSAGLFAGESMFSDATDASKVALVSLVDWLVESGATLLDVQWTTPHLVSVGADRRAPIEIPRVARRCRRRALMMLLAEMPRDGCMRCR